MALVGWSLRWSASLLQHKYSEPRVLAVLLRRQPDRHGNHGDLAVLAKALHSTRAPWEGRGEVVPRGGVSQSDTEPTLCASLVLPGL